MQRGEGRGISQETQLKAYSLDPIGSQYIRGFVVDYIYMHEIPDPRESQWTPVDLNES